MKKRVLVLGGSGMLGSMVVDYLARTREFELAATTRSKLMQQVCLGRHGDVSWSEFDASDDAADAPKIFEGHDWVINCIGIIKPLIHDDNAAEVERAVRINALFPHLLAGWTAGRSRVLQIATDCVYSGSKGSYGEGEEHDALDVYGKTKSVGEVQAAHVNHLRCSIVGPEMKEPRSLLEWFLGQAQGSAVNGFVNHNWNGVTTLHFAKLCQGIIKQDLSLPQVLHIIPDGIVTKCEMLEHFARCYGRDKVTIRPVEAASVIDRTLRTDHEDLNGQLWMAAGYEKAPALVDMIEELAGFDYGQANGRIDARN